MMAFKPGLGGLGNRTTSLPSLALAKPGFESEADTSHDSTLLSPVSRHSRATSDGAASPAGAQSPSGQISEDLESQRPGSPESPLPVVTTPPPASRLSREGVERLRVKLLERSRSLHEAFVKLGKRNTLTKELPMKELRSALARIGDVDDDEFFAALGAERADALSLMTLWRAFLTASPEAMLWELRCGLVSQRLWPTSLRRAPLPEDVSLSQGCQRFRALIEAQAMLSFSRDEWQKLCNCVGLTVYEEKRLFSFFLDKRTGTVSWGNVCDHVKAVVAPGVSCLNFTSKLLHRFGSLRAAYSSACSLTRFGMRHVDFSDLASQIGVGERPASRLWRIFVRADDSSLVDSVEVEGLGGHFSYGNCSEQVGPGEPGPAPLIAPPTSGVFSGGLTQHDFVQRLLPWAPESALDKLAKALRDHFGSLAKSRQALRQHSAGGLALTPRSFQETLKAAGFCRECDTDVVLAKLRELRRRAGRYHGDIPEELTVDDVVDGLRALDSLRNMVMDDTWDAQEIVKRQTLPVWRQLHAVQHEIERCSPSKVGGGVGIRAGSSHGTRASSTRQQDVPSRRGFKRCATASDVSGRHPPEARFAMNRTSSCHNLGSGG